MEFNNKMVPHLTEHIPTPKHGDNMTTAFSACTAVKLYSLYNLKEHSTAWGKGSVTCSDSMKWNSAWS